MIDEREVREMLHRRARKMPATPADPPKAVRRARRRLLVTGALTTVAAAAIVAATVAGVDAIRTAPIPAVRPTPSLPPVIDVQRVDVEVLSFTGVNHEMPGDLVAVNPETGEERVLVQDLDNVYEARWSADGRWVAYETDAADGGWRDLWVAGEAEEPQLVATGGDPGLFADIGLYWTWSPTGARIATIGRSRLTTIDLTTGETTHLGKVIADLLETNQPPTWAWSPDGTRLVFAAPEGAPEGSLHTVDLRTGERSLLASLPDDWDLTERVVWSPDGTRIAVLIRKASNEAGRLYVMDADGSDIQVVADDYDPLGVAWSPDGTRLAFGDGSEAEREVRMRVLEMNGGMTAGIGSLPFVGCTYNYMCSLTWSPDGSQIAFRKDEGGEVTVFDADGAGEAEPIDELTYLSWEGGSYPWEA